MGIRTCKWGGGGGWASTLGFKIVYSQIPFEYSNELQTLTPHE